MIVCPNCGMSTWVEDFGCALPGCENYAVLKECCCDPPHDDPDVFLKSQDEA